MRREAPSRPDGGVPLGRSALGARPPLTRVSAGPGAWLLAALGAALVLPACELRERPRPKDEPRAEVPLAAAPAPAPTGRSARPDSFADLAEQCDSAVVFVRTVTSRRRGFYRELTGGSGSGFIFDASGKILTNYHVVQGAHAIQVELSDDRAFMAEVLGVDPHTDVAVLSVKADNLPSLPLGDSSGAQVGDWVLAIGNPFGLAHTVSAGIISAKGRTSREVKLGNPGAYYSFLQTDASINPGNSGGPLIDTSGHVIGMNTAINPEANSIGFAIPVDMLRELLPRLLRDGVVQRAALGVHVDVIDRDVQEQLGLPHRRGALILRVQPGGPAMVAGIRPGDVVVKFAGKDVLDPEDLRWRASLADVGKPVDLVVWRDGKALEVTAHPAPLAEP